MSSVKPVSDLQFKDLKAECILRHIPVVGKSMSFMKNRLEESRVAYPDPKDVPVPTNREEETAKKSTKSDVKKEETKINESAETVGEAVKLPVETVSETKKEELKEKKKGGRKGTKINEILELYIGGASYDEIQKKGYNLTTIRIQCARYNREHPEFKPKAEPKPVKIKEPKAEVKTEETKPEVTAETKETAK